MEKGRSGARPDEVQRNKASLAKHPPSVTEGQCGQRRRRRFREGKEDNGKRHNREGGKALTLIRRAARHNYNPFIVTTFKKNVKGYLQDRALRWGLTFLCLCLSPLRLHSSGIMQLFFSYSLLGRAYFSLRGFVISTLCRLKPLAASGSQRDVIATFCLFC